MKIDKDTYFEAEWRVVPKPNGRYEPQWRYRQHKDNEFDYWVNIRLNGTEVGDFRFKFLAISKLDKHHRIITENWVTRVDEYRKSLLPSEPDNVVHVGGTILVSFLNDKRSAE